MVARYRFAGNAAIFFLRIATDGLFGSFCIYASGRPMKPLLVGLRPSDISLIDFKDFGETICEHAHDMAAEIMTQKKIKAV